MEKYLVCRWEDNGYHDSYFYAGLWNPETKSTEKVMEGATAFAGGCRRTETPINQAPESVQREFREWAINYAAIVSAAEDYRLVMSPDRVEYGNQLSLLKEVNCKGVVAKAGEVGKVFWMKAYGAFYKNGYKKPNRSNTNVGLKFDDGRVVFVGLSKCRLADEPRTVEQFKEKYNYFWDEKNFGIASLFGVRGWLSENYVFSK